MSIISCKNNGNRALLGHHGSILSEHVTHEGFVEDPANHGPWWKEVHVRFGPQTGHCINHNDWVPGYGLMCSRSGQVTDVAIKSRWEHPHIFHTAGSQPGDLESTLHSQSGDTDRRSAVLLSLPEDVKSREGGNPT